MNDFYFGFRDVGMIELGMFLVFLICVYLIAENIRLLGLVKKLKAECTELDFERRDALSDLYVLKKTIERVVSGFSKGAAA